MKLTLTYDGDLPSSGNKSKPHDVSRIRNYFHDQLADLWDSHIILRQLRRTARTQPLLGGGYWGPGPGQPVTYSPIELPDYNDPIPPMQEGQTDFCAPIQVPNSAKYIPLIRKSLHLACALDIHFLRHEEPGMLVLQGGDLDGRLKTPSLGQSQWPTVGPHRRYKIRSLPVLPYFALLTGEEAPWTSAPGTVLE